MPRAPYKLMFPLYVAETENGERIAGPSHSCQRMQIASSMYSRMEGTKAKTLFLGTITSQELQVLLGVR